MSECQCRCPLGAAILGSVALAAVAVFGWQALSTDMAAAPGLPNDIVPMAAATAHAKPTPATAAGNAPVVNLKTWEDTGKSSNIGH